MRIGVVSGMIFVAGLAAGQGHQQSIPQPRQQPTEDPAAVERGRALFRSSCGFCHGADATGARAPDLVRSPLVNHDDHGNLLDPVIRNGRPAKGMPSFSTLKDDQIADIVAFLHHQTVAAAHSRRAGGEYPLTKLLTGNAQEGKAYFDGPGGCAGCHSPTGDLQHIAGKYSPIDLQQRMVYPEGKNTDKTAVVTLKNGTRFEGKIAHQDEFSIALICQDGWYRSWPKADVTVEVHDPLKAHRELMSKYTDADMHNLFAYLETLK